MQYRKLAAERIFDGYVFHENHALVLTEDGTVADLLPSGQAGDAEYIEGILCPGFVNAHCHLELSHMKGMIAEKTGLVDFVYKVVTERHHPLEDIYQAIEIAENEMIVNGIVAVGDICNHGLTIPQKKRQRIHYFNFIESSGWNPSVAAARFQHSKNIEEEFTRLYDETGMPYSITPHAPYSVSNDLWDLLMPGFEKKLLSIHNQETSFENDYFINGSGDFNRLYSLMKIENAHHRPTGKTSLQSYYHRLTNASRIILVHNSFITGTDIDYIHQQKSTLPSPPETFFCICINANQYIENSVPPIDLLREKNCTIVLGTDSLASNHQLSIIAEMETIKNFFPQVGEAEMLRWVTSNGAKALGMEHSIGSFEKGKTPGVLKLLNRNVVRLI